MNVKALDFNENGNIPNNPDLPVLIVQNALDSDSADLAGLFEKHFSDNGWTGCWRWGVYEFHHYHSNAHEALGVASGAGELHIGGEDGEVLKVQAGDLLILPAGTGHKCISSTSDFQVVGCYPSGQSDYDLIKEDTNITEEIRQRIRNTSLPDTDPLKGKDGPVVEHWLED